MTDPLHNEILDLLDESTSGLTIRKLLQAVPTANENQLIGALVALEETGRIEMNANGEYLPRRCKPSKVTSGQASYLDQRTRKGGVMTAEGHIPYFRHPAGWDLPVVVDDEGRPKRKNRRLVYALPGGGEYQPEDEESIARKMRGRM